jgi:hypothetical protein
MSSIQVYRSNLLDSRVPAHTQPVRRLRIFIEDRDNRHFQFAHQPDDG